MEEKQIYKFTAIPVSERFYNEDTSWGVFNFSTKDDIPELRTYKDPFESNAVPQKMSTLAGKMQKLYIGSEYSVTATLEYNNKYDTWQYSPISVIAKVPKTHAMQLMFLKAITGEQVAENLLAAYPNVVEDVANGKYDTIDFSKVKGVKDKMWAKIKDKILKNYVISEIIVMLQPLGVTYSVIKKLIMSEPNPSLLKEKLLDNPYIMTKIHGFGFKRVDDLALKINPELKCSMKRLVSYINYHLYEVGENEGHTWITLNKLRDNISDNVPECMDYLDDLLKLNNFLYVEEDKIGLKLYRDTETKIYNILLEKKNCRNPKFNFTDSEIKTAIHMAEKEQGFEYAEEQIKSIYKALNSDLAIISGKAGTGKTSISRAILRAYKNREMSISAMALSAKAAQRITEATNLTATTIHRALGAKGLSEFTYFYDNPLPVDVVFVDEASMINARLFCNLLEAVGEGTRIILSGDHMQLPPLGYGNIFSDILLRTDIFDSIQLTKVMRQAEKSGILVDANMIRDGINPIATPDLKIVHGELQDMYYMFRQDRTAMQNIAIKTFMSSMKTDGLDEVIIAVPRRQDCINSALEINKIIQDQLVGNNPYIDRQYVKYHLGAKVRQTVNDYEKNVFNGEIGYITNIYKLKEPGEVKLQEYCDVTFKDLKTNEDKIISYKSNELEQLDLSYAMTVHALQGSGYQTVIGIIDNTHYTLLDTCLLYTLITRAKKRCLLLAEPNSFLKCLRTNKNTTRQTWFKQFV